MTRSAPEEAAAPAVDQARSRTGRARLKIVMPVSVAANVISL